MQLEPPTPNEFLPKVKLELVEILGGFVCSNCGYHEDWRCLEIDHKYGRDRRYEPNNINLYYWLENSDEAVRDLQILCANCHRIKTWEDRKGLRRE